MKSLVDGQLATTATTVFTCGSDYSQNDPAPSVGGATFALSLTNTSGSLAQTILLFIQRGSNGSTTNRRIARVILSANETAQVSGLAMSPGDILQASTTTASTVDYVMTTVGTGPFTIMTLDANGAIKQVNGTSLTAATTITSTSADAEGLTIPP